MKFNNIMNFIGAETKTTKDGTKEYTLAKFLSTDEQVFQFFIMDLELSKQLKGLKKFNEYDLEIGIFNSKGNYNIKLFSIGGI